MNRQRNLLSNFQLSTEEVGNRELFINHRSFDLDVNLLPPHSWFHHRPVKPVFVNFFAQRIHQSFTGSSHHMGIISM